MKIILFIDGRNFISKISSTLNLDEKKNIDFSVYNFKGLFNRVLGEIKVDKKIFYLGRLIKYKEPLKKSEELIENQRHEAELYHKYKKFYGYVFYIGKKI